MSTCITICATGDSLIVRRLAPYEDPNFTGLVKILRSADVAFTNLEVVVNSRSGAPVVDSGGLNVCAPKEVVSDLKGMGFNLMAFANNHTFNYGEQAMLATLDELRAADLACAGAGRNLAEARAPSFLETARGRVGLVACASTFAPAQRAGVQSADLPGRPGLNPQRFDTIYVVDEAHMKAIQRIADLTGAEQRRQRLLWLGFAAPPKREGEFIFADRSFVVGNEFGIRTHAHAGDLAGNLGSVRHSREMSDLTVVSIHAHEQGTELWHPADFLVDFAHSCIDAGADMVVGHGPHVLRGLEIYKGKPIFYSLGNFFFQYEYAARISVEDREALRVDADSPSDFFRAWSKGETQGFPADAACWETVLPVCTFDRRLLSDILLYPVLLGFRQAWPVRGIPRLAGAAAGYGILKHFAALSEPFGTLIAFDHSEGRVKIPQCE